MTATLWLCGRFYENYPDNASGERTRWGWGGVFSTREGAVSACERDNDFICPVHLDHNSLPDFGVLVGQEYPKNPRGSEPAE